MKLTRREYTPLALHIVVIPEPGEAVPAITATSTQTLRLIDGAGNAQGVTVESVVNVVTPVVPAGEL